MLYVENRGTILITIASIADIVYSKAARLHDQGKKTVCFFAYEVEDLVYKNTGIHQMVDERDLHRVSAIVADCRNIQSTKVVGDTDEYTPDCRIIITFAD